MVISFSLENVRNHLLENGIVYTLRSKPHKEGKDWANSGRCTKKIAEVVITEFPFDDPLYYSKQSGFETLKQWMDAYCKLNHDPTMKKARLYRVEVIYPPHIKEEEN